MLFSNAKAKKLSSFLLPFCRPFYRFFVHFRDYQQISDLRQKAQAKIQSFNVRLTRQDPKSDTSSSQANKERLETKFRSAMNLMYGAFEEAYTLEHRELIEELQDHLVKHVIAQISSLFASSRCRTCYSGRHQTTAWRQSRFDNLAPLLCEVLHEAYKKAEDHQAVVILEKKKIEADGPPSDRFKLGLSEEDRRIYAALIRLERDSFNKELKELVSVNSLICMSRRWDNQKDNPPSLEVSLNHVALKKIC